MTERGDEQYESIPWDALVTDDARRRRRMVSLTVAAILVAGVAAAATRLLPSGVEFSPTTTVPGTASVVVPTAAPPSHADLSPELDVAAERRAVAEATWFVSDYFTVDGSDVTRAAVLDRLPEATEFPASPDRERSFVESAIALEAEDLGAGRVRVVVIVRALAAPDGVAYARQPARAVEVVVDVAAGSARIVDLPRPVELPEAANTPPTDIETAEPPEAALAAARAEAERWGSPGSEPVSVGKVSGLWRMVFTIDDDSGLSWPVAIWTDDDGAVVPAGSTAG